MSKPFGEDGEKEDKDKTKSIHAGACSGPTGEENLRVLAPKEGHVHHHLHVVMSSSFVHGSIVHHG
uniref:Uncharacterized protein n=1 Tax=Arabidopsis thaliana TaxID=3702 RepID=Q56W70_ARATH|nr:hypothetical protein [Arabidopsis thaliana]